MSATMNLHVRYYRALPVDRPGYAYEVLSLPVEQTALIAMHCWNIGCPDGPPVDVNYCVGMGWPQAAAEACRIMHEVIRPAMDAARSAGMPVCHVEADWMDAHYPEIPSKRDRRSFPRPSARQQAMLDRAHGPDYMTRSPLARMRRAGVVSPAGDEPMVFYSDQLDAYLKGRGIETLIYTGFAADMCVLNAGGGAQAMLARDYRCVLMRDGTVGVERPDTFAERLATRYGIHIFEWKVGYSTTLENFLAALEGIR